MLNQLQSQKYNIRFFPITLHYLNLLHLDSLSLEQRIEDEINENPGVGRKQ